MICISISRSPRQQAQRDLLDATLQCDLVEVQLDRFGHAPDVRSLIAGKPKPVIMSCRRRRDGGWWEGSEEERLALLRQCVVDGADYVEIELDIADQIRKLPPARRVVSYTNLKETPANIAEICEEALTKNPDAIRIAVPARTPEEAWPLLPILARAKVPTVVVGMSKPGIMLAVLGRKLGAPWVYAALERGLESFPGQPTAHDLEEIYHLRQIDHGTRLVGVVGFDEADRAKAAAFNAAFAACKLPVRCLPLGVGDLELFTRIISALKLVALAVDGHHRRDMVALAAELGPSAAISRRADLLLQRNGKWHAVETFSKTVVTALETAARSRHPGAEPLRDRRAVILGVSDSALTLVGELKALGVEVTLTDHDAATGRRAAQRAETGFVEFESLDAALYHIVVVCANEPGEPGARSALLASQMGTDTIVLDLTAQVQQNKFLREATTQGCAVVPAAELWLDQMSAQVKVLLGKEVPRQVLKHAASWL